MAWLQKIFLWLVYGVAGLAIIGLLLPDTVKVVRSIEIGRPASVIFSQIDRAANFNRWLPLYDLEPGAKYSISGPPAGIGSRLDWATQKVGSGSQTIQESVPFERVTMLMEFDGEVEAVSTLSLTQVGANTKVNWSFSQQLSFNPIDRWMGLLTPGFVGPDHERGLAKLKTASEAMTSENFNSIKPIFETVRSKPFAYVEGRSATDAVSANRALGIAFDAAVDGIVARNLKPGGYPIAVTLKHDQSSYQFRAGWPFLGDSQPAPIGRVVFGESPSGFVIRAIHPGTAATVSETYASLNLAAKAYGLTPNGPPWEVYFDNPSQKEVSDMRVTVLMPVK